MKGAEHRAGPGPQTLGTQSSGRWGRSCESPTWPRPDHACLSCSSWGSVPSSNLWSSPPGQHFCTSQADAQFRLDPSSHRYFLLGSLFMVVWAFSLASERAREHAISITKNVFRLPLHFSQVSAFPKKPASSASFPGGFQIKQLFP